MYPKEFKKFVNKCVQIYSWHLKIQHYSINIFYEHKASNKDRDGSIIAASIDVDRRYLNASVKIFPRTLDEWKVGNRHRVEEIVAHELSHVSTQHLFDLATATYKDEGETKDAWESLTELISRLSCKIVKLEQKK